MASGLHILQEMETEASCCSLCDATFRSQWPLPFELRDQDSGIVTYICPKCASKEQIEADFSKSLFVSYPDAEPVFGNSDEDATSWAYNQKPEHALHQLDRVVHPEFLDDVLTLLDLLRWHRLEHGQSDRPLHVLHIGCGDGALLNHLRLHASMPLVLVGIETCAPCAAKAQHCGLTISHTPLENEVRPAKIAFDLIIDHGSNEHLADPQCHREMIYHHLFEDGILVAERSDARSSRTEIYSDSMHSHKSNLLAQQRLATLGSRCVLFPMHGFGDATSFLRSERAAMHREPPALLPKRRTKSSWRIRLTIWANALHSALGERTSG